MFGLSADKEKVIFRAFSLSADDQPPCLYSGLFFTHFHKPYLRSVEEDRLASGLI